MKLLLKSIVAGLLIFGCTPGLFGQSAAEISRKSTEVIDLGSTQMDFTIYIRDNKGSERVRQLTMISGVFNGVGKTLVRFTAPSDVQGTTLLIYDNKDKEDDMWIYMPALKKVRRIISSERGKSFMGSEFTNADMSKPNQADFNYSLLGTTVYDGKECWMVQSEGRDQTISKAYGYSKSVSYIDKNSYLSYKVEYYDLSGNLHRILTSLDYKNVTKTTFFSYRTVMENVQNKRVSEMVVNKVETGTKPGEELFSPNALQ